MSFRVNFFPIPYVLVLILLVAFIAVFNETIFSYLMSNVEINGGIIVFFIFCSIWVLGSLAYFGRSAKLLSKLFSSVGPVVEKQSIKKDSEKSAKKSMVLQSSYSIAGTLFDSPVFSGILAKLDRKNKLEVSRSDADEIAQTIIDNAARVLAPSKFVASIFVLCGLIGTFLGLLETIGGVASALNTLATGGLSTDIGKFVKLLSDPLQGMSTAFSASLFGLTSALVSNFGNHTAWQKVLLFAAKVRNYLLSNTGVFDEDPARVSVRDLLISLEESFDMLYRGITNKLEDLTNHIATMGSVIVKTHERQERMLKVILKDHELMEQFWNKFLLGEEGIKGLVDEVAGRLSVVLPESMRRVFAPVLESMIEIMDNNSDMLDRAVRLAKESVDIQGDIFGVNNEISSILGQNTDILAKVNDELVGINGRLNLDEMAALIAEGNGIKHSIAGLMNESNNILSEANELQKDGNAINIEGNNLTSTLIGSVDNNTGAVEEVVGALSTTNAIVVDIKSINEQSNLIAQQGVGLAQEAIDAQSVANKIGQSILQEMNNSNSIKNDTLLVLSGALEESNQIARATLSGMLEVAQHNANIIRVLDERFGMIIAFSSDLLANANATLSAIDNLGNYLMSYYTQLSLDLRLDDINKNINNVAEAVACGLPMLDASVSVSSDILNSSNAIMQKLDNNNEIAASSLNIVNDILGNARLTNNSLNNMYVATTKYFDDAANFSSLYVGMDKQINTLLGSFLEFKERFDGFLSDSAASSQVLSNINALHVGVADRIQSIGSILNDIAITLNSMNGIFTEHKDLTMIIRDGINNILGQNDNLNMGVVSLGNAFNEGINRVVGGIGSINEISANYSQIMNNLLEEIVSNLSSLADINAKVSEVIDINNQSVGGIQQISTQLENQKNDNKVHMGISEEIKDILINADANVTGIGNILSNVKDNGEEVIKKLDNIVEFTSSATEHNGLVKDSGERIEKTLEQVATLINNLGVAYESYGNKFKDGLDEISKGISSVFHINEDIARVLEEINKLTVNIEQDHYGKSNNELLDNLKGKLENLISLKESVLNEFKETLNPILGDFNSKIGLVVDRLSGLYKIATNNNEFLNKIDPNADKKIVEQLDVVNESVSSLGKQFDNISTYLSSMSSMFGEQVSTISSIEENLKDLRATAKDLRDIPEVLNKCADAISGISGVVNSLNEKSESVGVNLNKISDYLLQDINSLIDVVKQLDSGFKGELSKIVSSNSESYGNMIELAREIASLSKNLLDAQKDSNVNSEALSQEVGKSLSSISSDIEGIKSAIINAINSQLMGELSKISQNQQEFTLKVEQIIPYVNELVRTVNDISSKSVNEDLIKAITSLEEIKNADIDNNSKLDLLINATNTLVSEMLNSRNVSQAILDIIAELGGFKKVK